MGTWKTAAAVVACGLMLAGCKAQVATSVNLSQLDDATVSEIPGKLRLEVSGCNSYEDSRQPSDSLVKAQEMLPRIFPNAEFKECYTQQFTSWAEFTLPVALDHTDDGQPVSADTFNLLSIESNPLMLEVPQELKQRMTQAKDANPMLGGLSLEVGIEVTNDTDAKRPVQAFGVWINDEPTVLSQFYLEPGSTTQISMSDVSISRAINYGNATILRSP